MAETNNIEETFFSLKTLTLRPRNETSTAPKSLNQANGARTTQRTLSIPTTQNLYETVLLLLRQQWRLLLLLLLLFINFLVMAVLFSQNNSRLEDYEVQMEHIHHTLDTLHPPETTESLRGFSGSSGISGSIGSSGSGISSGYGGSSFKNIFLSLASQQSEINSLREQLKSNTDKLVSLEKLRSRVSSFGGEASLLNAVLREANISYCVDAGDKLVAPLDAIYRVELRAKVFGATYINKKMFEINKNTLVLKNGGTLRVRMSGKENRKVECTADPRDTRMCSFMNEILLVKMESGDSLQALSMVEEGGEVYDFSFCMKTTNNIDLPGGGESVVITH